MIYLIFSSFIILSYLITNLHLRFLLTEEDKVRFPEAVCYSSYGNIFISEWSPGNLFCVKKFSLYND